MGKTMADAMMRAGMITQTDVVDVERRAEERERAEAEVKEQAVVDALVARWRKALAVLDPSLAFTVVWINAHYASDKVPLLMVEEWAAAIRDQTMTPDFGWYWLRQQSWYEPPVKV